MSLKCDECKGAIGSDSGPETEDGRRLCQRCRAKDTAASVDLMIQELREAGLDAWDSVEDIKAELGR